MRRSARQTRALTGPAARAAGWIVVGLFVAGLASSAYAGQGNKVMQGARLADKARQLGVADQVVFAGFIDDAEKADHFRVADAFVMPGRGEGFGFVFLEALASGIPVVGSVLDGSREALRNGELGALVDPNDARSIEQGIDAALATSRGVPQGAVVLCVACFLWARASVRS